MKFTCETEDDDWVGTIRIFDKSYTLTIRTCYERNELEEIALRARNFLETHWRRMHDQLTFDLLSMYNDGWRDAEEPPLNEIEFREAVGDPDVNIWEDEAIMLNFSDGGLFGGHSIEVFIEGRDDGPAISVGIVG